MRWAWVLPALLALVVVVTAAMPLAAQDGATPVSGVPFTQAVATPGGDLPGDPAIQLVKVVDGLVEPVNVAYPDDGSGRVFVVERIGRIRIVQDGQLLDQSFLDISYLVASDYSEQGMLGVAFDPDYATNGRFYVHYTDFWRNGETIVARYTVSADDPNVADQTSGKIILRQPQPYTPHNGGEIAFGPDGYLYIAIGDGGLAFEVFEFQEPDMGNLLGKILRIDVRNSGDGPDDLYAIPPDNPYVYQPGIAPETWVFGFRNPWQFSFDRVAGDLYLTDVGHERWEEINVLPPGVSGVNFGWPYVEGASCYPPTRVPCDPVGVPPVAQWSHAGSRCSAIAGIGVYRGEAFPALRGIYIAADFCTGIVRGLARVRDGWALQNLLDTGLTITGGGEDPAGELLLTSCACDFDRFADPFANTSGTLWRLVDADQVPPGAEVAPVDSLAAPNVTAPPQPVPVGTPGVAVTVGSPTAAQPERTIVMTEFTFLPPLRFISPDVDVPIELINEGAVPHNYSVDALGFSLDLQPGESRTVTIRAPAGTYEEYCAIPGHKGAGMFGTLVVE